MRYREQQYYFTGSRAAGAIAAGLVVIFAVVCWKNFRVPGLLLEIEFGIITLALAIAIYYTPDYLHITVAAHKPLRWAVRVRWRIIAATLVLGLLAVSNRNEILVVCASILWLIVANLLVRRLSDAFATIYFWGTDVLLVAALVLAGRLKAPFSVVLVAASAYFAVVISKRFPVLWGLFAGALGCSLVALGVWRAHQHPALFPIAAGIVLSSALGTALLIGRAQRHNARNVSGAMRELTDFTGYSGDQIRRLWEVSNQQLAENWKSAALDEHDAAALAQWYRENSRLYLFAISGYNLEYKRIRSNLRMLRLARGACLDYGAGNGEIVLELARRGHPAAYYDVEGETMAFARQRASAQGLNVNFFSSKNALSAAARARSFDTIFSFDVLEHLPDLQGELDSLASMLSSEGLLVFDVPAGATKSHPMHLDHRLDVCVHLKSKGLKDERGFWQRLPFRKEEKYFFRNSSRSGAKAAS